MLPRRRLVVLLEELNVDMNVYDVGHELEVRRLRCMRRLLLVRLATVNAAALACFTWHYNSAYNLTTFEFVF